ncbi:hypothetical protein C1646_673178 [Rhizophagus diaphanus]|nr:hypothetical protein C1646_673178 [Rhizophagus diaphanus] [Rhizophagus sp. MUCL 43196]
MSQRPLITPQIDNTIKELVKDLDNHPNICENISEKINKQYATNFTLKQIRQYLKDKLQIKVPQIRARPFTIQVESEPRGNAIPWKSLIPLESEFKKLRSESMVKNFWNLRKRIQESTKSKIEDEDSRKRKRSPKSTAKDEQQQKKVCRELNITFKYENIPSHPLNASSIETLFENDENKPPSNAMEILCRVADAMYKRDFPQST